MTTVETQGAIIRKVPPLIEATTDEARITVDDGFHTKMVDTSNTSMLDLSVPTRTFDEYDTEGRIVFGMDVGRFADALQFARKGRGNSNGDDVVIKFDDHHTEITTYRDDVQRTFTMHHIDTDSIRDSPDGIERGSAGVDTQTSFDPDTFKDIIFSVGEVSDGVHFRADDGDIILEAADEMSDEGKASDDDVYVKEDMAERFDPDDEFEREPLSGRDHSSDGSLISTDFLKPMAKAAAKKADMDRLTVHFGVECPAWFKFEDIDTGITAEYSVAPRIASE